MVADSVGRDVNIAIVTSPPCFDAFDNRDEVFHGLQLPEVHPLEPIMNAPQLALFRRRHVAGARQGTARSPVARDVDTRLDGRAVREPKRMTFGSFTILARAVSCPA